MSVLDTSWPASGPAESHPQQTSDKLPPHLGERPHSGNGEAAWSDCLGRKAARACRNRNGSFGDPKLTRLLLGGRELGLTAKASCQEVARQLLGSILTSLHTSTTNVLPSNSARRSQARWRGALP